MLYRRTFRFFIFCTLKCLITFQQPLLAQSPYVQDFEYFWQTVKERHAYLEEQQIDWARVYQIWRPKAALIKDDIEFIEFMEQVLLELHNGHVSLNTNLNTSNRLVPSGSDLFVVKNYDSYYIEDVRPNSKAAAAGVRPGLQVGSWNDQPINPQLSKFYPKSVKQPTEAMQRYALDMLFAGTHDQKRTMKTHNGVRTLFIQLDTAIIQKNKHKITVQWHNDSVAQLTINDCLYDYDLIAEFDAAMDTLMRAKCILLDLTDTPAGGNTTVARAIMGRFIDKRLPYQMHSYVEQPYSVERSWVEYVSPRGATYRGRLFVLVGHWTGSMGEGLAIGFDGLGRGTVVGTKMAGLLGAITQFEMPNTKISFQIPIEKLYHINGTPRAAYVPSVLTANSKHTLEKALELAQKR
jgi:C-terminal processing protease CtpA/Prc